MKKRQQKIRENISKNRKTTSTAETQTEKQETSQKTNMDKPRRQVHLNYGHYFLFFLLFLSLFTSYKLIQPYLNPIILAGILAIVLRPFYEKLLRWTRGRKNIAAFLACTLLTLVVMIPLLFLFFALLQQGVQSFNAIYDWVAQEKYRVILEHPLLDDLVAAAQEYLPSIQKLFPDFELTNIRLDKVLLQLSSTTGKYLLNQGGMLVTNLSAIAIQFFLMLFVLFFFLRDQDIIFKAILHLSPLSNTQEREILSKIETVAKSVFLGTFVTGVAQGVAGGVAFSIAHLPGLFWGTVMAFASLIPVVGTALIWVPVTLYLFLSGHWGYGIFMVLWCSLIVGMLDNFVRPLFMKSAGTNMSTLLIFLAVLGGLKYFGLIGLLYGPLLIGLTIVFLYIYSLEFESFLTQQDQN
ncbi:hypothetical protein U27_03076 [Candidatus Vecturithrix granuli]|uniref:Permease n=1 Tax=Vecturithrix granuli TaxID=1499967 RepID=A0A081BUV9_VECG1|nr:hypothetical protein U27_03076 [Candidatus Vecturithrix granuli]